MLYEQSPVPFQSLDANGILLSVNNAWLAELGYEREDVLGRSFGDFLAQDEVEAWRRRFAIFKEQGAAHSVEWPMKRKDGSYITMALDGVIARDANGAFLRTHCVLTNVTERKKVEESIRIMAAMLDTAPSSITVHNQQGQFLYANRKTCELHGYTQAEFMSLNLRQVDVPASAALIDQRMQIITEKGEATFEVAHFRKDGPTIPLEVFVKQVEWAGVPAMLSIATDITERKAAEQALRESEERHRLLFDSAGMGIGYYDLEGRAIAFNRKAGEHMGGKPAEFVGKSVADLYPDGGAEYLRRMRLAVQTGESAAYEDEVALPTATMWFRSTYSPLRDAQGAIVGVQVIADDITERKRMEAALDGSEKKYRELFENMVVGLYRTTPDGRVLEANAAIVAMFGYPDRESFLRCSVLDLYVNPAQRAVFHAAAGNGDTVPGLEVQFRRLDGTTFWAEDSARVFRDAAGNIVCYEGSLKDITERKRAEEALRASEQRFRDIADNAQEWIWETDTEGAYTYASHTVQRILGYTAAEVLQKHFYDFFLPEEREALKTAALEAFAAKQAIRGLVNRNMHKNGQTVWLSTSGLPLLDDQGNLIGYRGADVDITERKQAEDALRSSETLLSESQRIAHLGSWTSDLVTGERRWSDETYRIFDWPIGKPIGIEDFRACIHPEDLPRLLAAQTEAQKGIAPLNIEYRILRPDGEVRHVYERSVASQNEGGTVTRLTGVVQDITDRKRAEQEIRRNETRLRSVVRVLQHPAKTTQEFMKYALDEAIALTESTIGYIFLFDDERQEFTFSIWSRDVMKECALPDLQMTYALSETGLWGEPVRQRRAIVINDFHAPHPFKRGYPAGHATLHRFATVPVFSADKVVAVVGVANKETTYDDTDVLQLTLLMDAVWKVVEQRRAQEELRSRAEQQAALNDVIGAANRSGDDLQSLLDSTLAGISRALHVEMGAIWLRDGHNGGGLSAVRGFPADMPQERSEWERLAVSIEDLMAFEKAASMPPALQALAERVGVRAWTAAALQADGEPLGGLVVASAQPRQWTPDERALLQSVGGQLGMAVARTRLQEDMRQRLEEIGALYRVSTALRAAQNLDDALSLLLDESLHALDVQVGAISLYQPETNDLRIAAARGWLGEMGSSPLKPGQGIAGSVFATGEPRTSVEFVRDPAVHAPNLPQTPQGWGGAFAPIKTAEESVGVLMVATPMPRQVSPAQVRLLSSLAEMGGATIHRMRLHERTEIHVQRLAALHAIDAAMAASTDLHLTLDVLLSQITTRLNVDAADVLLLQSQGLTLQCAAARGFATGDAGNYRVRMGDGLAGRAAILRKPMYVADLLADKTAGVPSFVVEGGFVAYAGLPLLAKGKLKGVLELHNRSPLPSDTDWTDLLEMLAQQTAVAIDHAQMFDGLQRSNLDLTLAYDETIEGWSRALDLRDPVTEGHTERVTAFSLRMARAMGVSAADQVQMRRGGLLHDIGKIGVPDAILKKPGPLTNEEWEIMRGHPTLAYDLLSRITHLQPALEIPYYHHEKWDGTGYPKGLKGPQIPLAARLFAIADVWDALTSDRPYRAAWSHDKALAYIQEESGRHFDPQVVAVFLKEISAHQP
jgi:PAS domain S-box-containing protein